MDVSYTEDVMRFFRKGHKCKNVCSFYKAAETVNSKGVVNQYRCNTCDTYLIPAGIIGTKGSRLCKCCDNALVYVERIDVNSNSQIKHEEKLSTPNTLQPLPLNASSNAPVPQPTSITDSGLNSFTIDFAIVPELLAAGPSTV